MKIVAPDRAYEIQVVPVLTADENETPVSLRRCGDSSSLPLFVLERTAELYWAADSRTILVVNKPSADEHELLVFDVPGVLGHRRQTQSHNLNGLVYQQVLKNIGPSKEIGFYLVDVIAWRADSLVLAVGGVTHRQDGGTTPYCYGFVVVDQLTQVKRVLSERELRTMFRAHCQTFP